MAVNISALTTELVTDPQGLGYSTFVAAGDLNRLVDLLNTPGLASGTVSVATVFSVQLQANVVGSEYLVISAGQRNLWDVIIATGQQGLALSNTLIRQQIGVVWSAGTTTRSNLSNLQVRAASRGEVLFGENTSVQTGEVDLALQ